MDALFKPRYIHERLFARIEITCYCTDITSTYQSGRIVKLENWHTPITSFVRVQTFVQTAKWIDMTTGKEYKCPMASWNGGKYKRRLLKPS